MYTYQCQGETIEVTDDTNTNVEHNIYFYAICDKCCNIPVLHLIDRKSDKI